MARTMIEYAVGKPVSRVPEGERAQAGVSWGDCGQRAMCLPYGPSRKVLESYEQCAGQRYPLTCGEMLYKANLLQPRSLAAPCGRHDGEWPAVSDAGG